MKKMNPKSCRHLLKELRRIQAMPRGSNRKSTAMVPLIALMAKSGFIRFTADNSNILPGAVGYFFHGDLPVNKTGHLRPLAGKKAIAVCIGSGVYASRQYMAGPI